MPRKSSAEEHDSRLTLLCFFFFVVVGKNDCVFFFFLSFFFSCFPLSTLTLCVRETHASTRFILFLSLSLSRFYSQAYKTLFSFTKELEIKEKKGKQMIAALSSSNRATLDGLKQQRRRSPIASSALSSSVGKRAGASSVARRAFGRDSGSDSDGWIEKLKQGARKKRERTRKKKRGREKKKKKKNVDVELSLCSLSLSLVFALSLSLFLLPPRSFFKKNRDPRGRSPGL